MLICTHHLANSSKTLRSSTSGQKSTIARLTPLLSYVSPSSPFRGFRELTLVAAQYNPSNYIVLNDGGTSHLAAADKWGNVISLTTSESFPPRVSSEN